VLKVFLEEVFLATRDAALRKYAWKLMFQQLACMGFTFNIHHRNESTSETGLDIFGADVRMVFETVLTEEHVRLTNDLTNCELKTKLELSDGTI
jgi:hypothetical protein